MKYTKYSNKSLQYKDKCGRILVKNWEDCLLEKIVIKHNLTNTKLREIVLEKIKYFYPQVKKFSWTDAELLLDVKKLNNNEVESLKNDAIRFCTDPKKLDKKY